MTFERDLFGAPVAVPDRSLPGLRHWPEVVSQAHEADLIARIDACDLQPFRFQGWLGKRFTCSFGWDYDFDEGRFERAAPLPDWLLAVRRIVAASAGLAADDLEQALLIRYDPGAGIGWHRDRPVFDHVIGLSLGNPAVLRFRRRSDRGFDRFALDAMPRGAYHLAGEDRYDWEHSITEMTVPRWSITFRTFRKAAGGGGRPETLPPR